MQLDAAQLAALAAVVSEGTFDAAATRLHVTPSAVSQRVKALETQVGRVLVRRSKPVQPTPSGEAVLRLARQVQSLTAETLREIGEDATDSAPGAVTVPLAVNADSIDSWLLPALAAAGGATGEVVFDLRRDDQQRTVELLREGSVMAAVTSVLEPVPGCSVQRIGRMRYRACASPGFVTRWFPDGPTSDALSRAPIVVYDRSDHLQDRYLRHRTRRRIDPPRHHVPGSHAFAEAVRLGLGWGMLPDEQTAGLRSGALVDVEPGYVLDVTLYWQQWRLRSAVLDRVARAVRAALD